MPRYPRRRFPPRNPSRGFTPRPSRRWLHRPKSARSLAPKPGLNQVRFNQRNA
jgi:hypothetical protein